MPEDVLYPIRDLIHRSVVDPEGRRLGDVRTLDCNPRTWRIDAIEVRLTREATSRLGVETPLFEPRTVRVPSEFVEVRDDYLLVREPETLLREEFRREHPVLIGEGTQETD